MFQATVSPKMLNVEKLEKKFASLTRSRESIQGLSMWIIRHKDFYKEIVNQWLQALTKDFNALTMFYVANDVIQNCGRKKAPEFREAFASVLEKAVSLQKVKDIKTEVTRMLTLWHDRAIYDDDFFKKLEEKLNAAVDECESEREEELSEAEVIANFKLENVINSLEKLKTLEEELHEKETFLEDIEEPGMCNIDNLIVKMDSQKELRKFDKFQKLVEDCIALTDKVLAAKKAALLNLKYSSIFYNAQMEDAKKVAHAYRIYGKKVKMLEKSLSMKMATLPEQTLSSPQNSDLSPCVELNSSQESLNTSLVCTETDKSGQQENISEACFSAERTESELKGNTIDKKEKNTVDGTSPSAANTIIVESDKDIQDEGKVQKPLCSSEIVAKDSTPELNESVSKVEDSVTKKASDSKFQALPDTESIDFLLEKAYDDQVKGSKLSFKRKIDNLLKLKQAKSCKLANEEDNTHNKMLSDNKMTLESKSQNKISQSVSSDCQTLSFQSSMCNSTENNSDISVSPLLKDDGIVNTKSTNEADKMCSPLSVTEKISETLDVPPSVGNIDKVSNLYLSEKSKDDQSTEVIPGIEISTNDESKNISSSNSFAFQTLPDIPTELLKNILDKHRINMNLSSNSDTPTSNASAQCSATKHSQIHASQNEGNKDMNLHSNLITTDKSSKSTNSGVTGTSQEYFDGDNTFGSKVKDSALITSSLFDSDKLKKNREIKSTVFLENLHNVLEHFTKKETSFKDIKCSETMSIPLENTLKVFNCIMQNCNEVDCIDKDLFSSSNCSNTSISGIPSKEFLVSKKFSSAENEINNVSQGTSLAKQESSDFCNKEDEFEKFSINSKNDNLEIIDMEVDSDDENS